MRGLRIAAYVAAGSIGLIAVALVLVVVFVDPNDYRDDIERVVESKTGRQLTLSGDLQAVGVSLAGAQGRSGQPGRCARFRRRAVRLDSGSARRRAAAAVDARQDRSRQRASGRRAHPADHR